MIEQIENITDVTQFRCLQDLQEFLDINSLSGEHIHCCGGLVSSIVNKSEIHPEQDIDLFFTSQEAFDSLKNVIQHRDFIESEFAISFYIYNIKIQCIKKIYNSVYDILRDFDLDACKCSLTQGSLINLSSMNYKINIESVSGLTALRVLKYFKRGFAPVNLQEFCSYLLQNFNKEHIPDQYGEPYYSYVMISDLLRDAQFRSHYKSELEKAFLKITMKQATSITISFEAIDLNIPAFTYWRISTVFPLEDISTINPEYIEHMQNELAEYLI